ncbi:MAG: signal peptidase I [Candidatus Magasanikbacteria bacterium]|nr:signal peptidase I [Candidatus Magasanikbacteria bacterium]
MKKILSKLNPKNWAAKKNEETLTPQSSAKLFFLELFKLAFLAVITIILVRYFLFKPFYVRGASMEPTFFNNEYLIIDELTYRLKEPHRGDVIVLKSPLNKKEFFLKRVVGLPGETVKIRDGQVMVYNEEMPDGFVLNEPYLPVGLKTVPDASATLGDNKFFVLGDNRFSSLDSRMVGPIDSSAIIGRVILRGWPFDRARWFATAVNY